MFRIYTGSEDTKDWVIKSEFCVVWKSSITMNMSAGEKIQVRKIWELCEVPSFKVERLQNTYGSDSSCSWDADGNLVGFSWWKDREDCAK